MYQVYETASGKRRYSGRSFDVANKIKETLERNGIRYSMVFMPS